MTAHKDFLAIMRERGFLHQCTDEAGLAKAMEGAITAYIGFDCTAPSLHVGSLMQIMVLRWLQKCGHRPIVLMGGGTTKIGDPSGKDEARKLLDDAGIAANMAGIKNVFKSYLQFEGEGGNALMLNNDDWLRNLNYIEFLRDYGRHFSVNRMMSMDSVKLRLEREQNLSFLEFNYMILQAYDFVELKKRYGCRLQIGGSDQWGNIVMGAELGRRDYFLKLDPTDRHPHIELETSEYKIGSQLFGLTTPLITTSSGAKMGKTAAGAVWLNADMLSPFDYWQFWRNTEDGDVRKFLLLFTELEVAEIDAITAKDKNINEAKKVLANEATKLCHGTQAAEEAAETARKTFEEGGAGGALPEVTLSARELQDDAALVRTLLVRLGFAESGGEAKKLIAGNGVRLNDQPVTDAGRKLAASDFIDGIAKLSKGKKHHARVRWSEQ